MRGCGPVRPGLLAERERLQVVAVLLDDGGRADLDRRIAGEYRRARVDDVAEEYHPAKAERGSARHGTGGDRTVTRIRIRLVRSARRGPRYPGGPTRRGAEPERCERPESQPLAAWVARRSAGRSPRPSRPDRVPHGRQGTNVARRRRRWATDAWSPGSPPAARIRRGPRPRRRGARRGARWPARPARWPAGCAPTSPYGAGPPVGPPAPTRRPARWPRRAACLRDGRDRRCRSSG